MNEKVRRKQLRWWYLLYFSVDFKKKLPLCAVVDGIFSSRISPLPCLPSQFFAFCLLYFSCFKCLILHNRHFASWLSSIHGVNLNISYLTADSSRLCFFCAAGRIPPPPPPGPFSLTLPFIISARSRNFSASSLVSFQTICWRILSIII